MNKYNSKCDIDVIHHARKSLLFDGSRNWIKKHRSMFDVPVGAHDGAEMCKLVGTYMLNLSSKRYNKNDFALYCDVGLAVFENKRGPQLEKVKKNIQKICKEHGLDIIIQSNMKIVNYSDVTFNLNDGTYKPYTQPISKRLNIYIKTQTIHQAPSIIPQIPVSIESRLSALSSTKDLFQEVVPPYQKALQNSVSRHTYL